MQEPPYVPAEDFDLYPERARFLAATASRNLGRACVCGRLSSVGEGAGQAESAKAADNPPGFAPGLSLVAAVIRRRDGQPAGGLIVSGTELEQYTSRDSEVALQLLRVAKQIGSVLG